MKKLKLNAEQIDQLAAEYVIGTLQNTARRRFERLITERADARFAVWQWEVWQWERFLNQFSVCLAPRKPSLSVWANVRRRINPAHVPKEKSSGWLRGLWLSVPAAIAAAWLAVVMVSAPDIERVAIFADSGTDTLWVISADLDRGLLLANTINAPTISSANSFELWLLPVEGPPLSLGVLNVEEGMVSTDITARVAAAMETAGSLAISLEPAGGSLTGLPTGPILYQASLLSI